MSQSTKLEFWITTLQPIHGASLRAPIFYPLHRSYVSSNLHFAREIMRRFQTSKLKNGQYSSVVTELPKLTVEPHEIKLTLSPLTLPYLPAEIECNFSIGLATLPNGDYFGIAPTVGVQSYGSTPEEATERLRESIRVALKYLKVGASPYRLLQHIWWEHVTFEEIKYPLAFFTLAELNRVREAQQKTSWLSTVAQRCIPSPDRKLIGMQTYVKRLTDLEKSPFQRSILLIGTRGVGKSEVIGQWLKEREYEHVWETSATYLIRKLTTSFGWQSNLTMLIKEVQREGALLYITNFADLFEVGRSVGQNLSLGEVIKDEIAQGKLKIIAECNPEERASVELKYPDALSPYHVIDLAQPEGDQLSEIIRDKGAWLCERASLSLSLDQTAVDEIISLHKRFAPYSGFPAKPLHFIRSMITRLTSRRTNAQLDALQRSGFTFTQAMESIESEAQETQEHLTIDRALTAELFCEESGLPHELISADQEFDLQACTSFFEDNIFGQPEAVEVLVNCISTLKSGLNRPSQPIASLLFIGSTGVGKTEMVKVLAEYLFSNRDRMIRFDMSEFADPINVMRLTGVRRGEEGLLTSAVRDHPFSILLFDEVEKAHSDFFDLLLQILGAGRLTSRSGHTVDFCSTMIVMTSNLGAQSLKHNMTGFRSTTSEVTHNQDEAQGNTRTHVKDHFERAVRRALRPELYNRIGHIVPFIPLDHSTLNWVLKRELNKIQEREGLAFRGHQLELSDEALNVLGRLGYSDRYGARQVQRALRECLTYQLAQNLNRAKNQRYHILVQATTEARESAYAHHESTSPIHIVLSPIKRRHVERLTSDDDVQMSDLWSIRRALYVLFQQPDFREVDTHIDYLNNDIEQLTRKIDLVTRAPHKFKNAENRLKTHQDHLGLLNANAHFFTCLRGYRDQLYREARGYDVECTQRFLDPHQHQEHGLKTGDRHGLLSLQKRTGQLMLFMHRYLFRAQDLCRLIIYGPLTSICTLLRCYLVIAERLNQAVYCEPIWSVSSFKSADQITPRERREWADQLRHYMEMTTVFDASDRLSKKESLIGISLEISGCGARYAWLSEAGSHELFSSDEDAGSRCLVLIDDELISNWPQPDRSHSSLPMRSFYYATRALRTLTHLLKTGQATSDPAPQVVASESTSMDCVSSVATSETSSSPQTEATLAIDETPNGESSEGSGVQMRRYHQKIIAERTWAAYQPPPLDEVRQKLSKLQLMSQVTHPHNRLLDHTGEVISNEVKIRVNQMNARAEGALLAELLPDLDRSSRDLLSRCLFTECSR